LAERFYAQGTVFIFDLDKTLYSEESGLLAYLDQRINDYLVNALGIRRESVDEVRKRWVEEYGTTLRGAQVNCGIDPLDYIAYTHDIEIRKFLSADEELLRILKALPGIKVVFSNSPRGHADGVIDALGLTGVFERIYTIEFCEYEGKPARRAYERVLADLGVPATHCVMIEDTARNLVIPHEMGMTTVLLSKDRLQRHDHVDYVVAELRELLEIGRWSAAS